MRGHDFIWIIDEENRNAHDVLEWTMNSECQTAKNIPLLSRYFLVFGSDHAFE